MRIVATLYGIHEIEPMTARGVDVFLVNTQELSTKTPSAFSHGEITELTQIIHRLGKQVYLNLNAMILEDDLPILEEMLGFISHLGVDGIVCLDLTVLATATRFGLAEKIIYRPGTMNTNSYDPWFFRKLHIKGLTLSKDITLEELVSIGENYQGMEISVVGHGYLFLFYSKRMLLKTYFDYRNLAVSGYRNSEGFRLIEKSRKQDLFPILEDRFGTHIFRSKKLQSFNEINVLRPYLSDVFIERLFLDTAEYLEAIDAYLDETKEDGFMARYGREYDSGFYYQKTTATKGVDSR
jgi:putative protease